MAHTRSLLIIGLLFLLLVALGTVFFVHRKTEEDVYLVYTAIFEVDAALAEAFTVGDRLFDARGKEEAGEILKVTRENTLCEDIYGVYFHPERVTLALTLGGIGKNVKGNACIGTLTPRVGEALYLLGKGKLEGTCIRVRTL